MHAIYFGSSLFFQLRKIRQNYYKIRSPIFIRLKKMLKIWRCNVDDRFLKNRDLVRLETLAQFAGGNNPQRNAAVLLLTICNRRGAMCTYFTFFLHAERAGTGRDLVTRHPSEISSFALDIERRIYKSKRGSAKFTRAFSPIGPPDISDLSMPPDIYERVVRIVIKARYRIFICDAICIYM